MKTHSGQDGNVNGAPGLRCQTAVQQHDPQAAGCVFFLSLLLGAKYSLTCKIKNHACTFSLFERCRFSLKKTVCSFFFFPWFAEVALLSTRPVVCYTTQVGRQVHVRPQRDRERDSESERERENPPPSSSTSPCSEPRHFSTFSG